MARFILLTGLIGSGKSYVAEKLRAKRYTVVDSDSWAKRQYDDPETFKFVVERLGPMCLDEKGKIDLGYIKRYILRHDPDDRDLFTWGLATRVANAIEEMFGNTREIVFVEAAPTAQVGHMCNSLGIDMALVVKCNPAIRRQRLVATREMSGGEIDAFENLQDLSYIHHTYGRNLRDVKKVLIDNNCDRETLNGRLMDIIEKEIQPTPEEKFALYERYLRESPEYCKQNAMCYSFYNLGGCNNCPFPCSQQDRNFERANREFMEEKAVKTNKTEDSIGDDIDLTEHEVDAERSKFVEALAWTNISGIPETVRIGDQVWMNCNLQAPSDPENGVYVVDGETYFTWEAAVREAKKYESLGFWLPTREDWEKLEKFCRYDAGKKLKSTSGWYTDGNGTDSFGFNGKPAGHYFPGDSRVHTGGKYGYFWSATPYGTSYAYYRNLYCDGSNFGESCRDRSYGFSVRLLKDAY